MGAKMIITISRQLGSGGSYIGQVIAGRLGIKYMDREVLRLAAEALGMEEDELAPREGRLSSFWEKMGRIMAFGPPESPYVAPPLRPVTDEDLFAKETEIMKSIAEREDCVIMGRAAVHALQGHPGMTNVFLWATLPFRIRRVMEIYQARSEKEARALIAASDEMRSRFFREMTGREWSDARSYDLCLNTGTIPLAEAAETILDFLQRKRVAVST